MAFSKIELRPVTGPTLLINDNNYPVFSLETDPQYSDPEMVEKAMLSGEWPTYSLSRGMPITMEGAIFGYGANDAAMAADTATKRQTFLTALHRVNDTTPPTSRPHGVLRLRAEGWSEDADASYHIVSVRAPIIAGQPNIVEWFVGFKMFNIWFTGISTSTKYFL